MMPFYIPNKTPKQSLIGGKKSKKSEAKKSSKKVSKKAKKVSSKK
jgi:hypothetical protein